MASELRWEIRTTETRRGRFSPVGGKSTGTVADRRPRFPRRRSTGSRIRGALFTASGTGFVQAPPSGLATTFNNPTYSTFSTFSDPRLFTPIGSTLTNVAFLVPGTNGATPATVTGFGAVFSDVHATANASLSFVNAGGVPLGSFFVPAANNGLSFLGVIFPDELIGQVQIISGNVPLGPSESSAIDIIVIDDFIYKEPAVVPEPTTLLFFGTTMTGLGLAARWRRRRQS